MEPKTKMHWTLRWVPKSECSQLTWVPSPTQVPHQVINLAVGPLVSNGESDLFLLWESQAEIRIRCVGINMTFIHSQHNSPSGKTHTCTYANDLPMCPNRAFTFYWNTYLLGWLAYVKIIVHPSPCKALIINNRVLSNGSKVAVATKLKAIGIKPQVTGYPNPCRNKWCIHPCTSMFAFFLQ